jgi:predicted Zn-dependent peptidase
MQAGASGPLAAADRSKLPDVGAIADLDFPTVERAKLSNGVPIVYVQRNAVPMTQVSVSFDAGNAADPRDRLGTQSFMLSLLDEGAAGMTSVQIAEAQERLGATIGSGASMDRTTVNLSALSANLDPSLALLADVVLKPDFAPAEVERLRSQQLARIQSELKAPQSIALRTLPPLLFGNQHPYGVSFTGTGDAATVASVTRDELVGFHHKWLRPEKATIFVVSDQPLAKIVKTLDAKFGKWPVTGAAGTKAEGGPVPAAQPRIVLVDRPDSPQSYILAGQVLPKKGTDDIETLITANQAVGAGFLSRINMDLRETKGWSYGVRAQVGGSEDRIPFMVMAPVQTNQTGPSLKVLIDQAKDIVGAKPITAEERDVTVTSNILELPGSYEQSVAVLGQMRADALFKRPFDYAEKLAGKYSALTASGMTGHGHSSTWPNMTDSGTVRPWSTSISFMIVRSNSSRMTDWAMWLASFGWPLTTGTGRGPQPSSAGWNSAAHPSAKVGMMEESNAVQWSL